MARDLIRRAWREDPAGTAYAGRIADPAKLTVTLPGLDGGTHAVAVRDIPPRSDGTPARGDECLVVLDDLGNYWVASWIPASGA